MTFWKVSDTRIGCRITMQEIKDMGFEFQELSKERQKTAEFLGRILESARDALKIELPDGVQSFTAQVLPDQSLLLVISCADINWEIDRNMEILENRIFAMNDIVESGKIDQVRSLEGQEKADAFNELMEEIEEILQSARDEEDEEEAAEFPGNGGVTVEVQPLAENIKEPVCQVLFETLDDTISFCSALGEKAVPSSRLYKHNDRYYLFADFTGAEGEKAAAGFLNLAGEFGGDTAGKGVSEAFLKEHKRCMISSQAVEKLGTIG